MTPRGRGWNAYQWERAKRWGVSNGRPMRTWDELTREERTAWTTVGVAEAYREAGVPA